MAILTLTKVWINLVETGDAVSAYSTNRSETNTVEGEVKVFASGRKRSFTSVGDRTEFRVTLRDVSSDDLDVLRSWKGQTLILRDHTGRKLFGTFYSLDIQDRKTVGLCEATLAFMEVTYEEGV